MPLHSIVPKGTTQYAIKIDSSFLYSNIYTQLLAALSCSTADFFVLSYKVMISQPTKVVYWFLNLSTMRNTCLQIDNLFLAIVI